MNRLDEIKERLSYFPRELKDGGFSDNSLAFGARLDIEYLLSTLEIAEKALEEIRLKSQIIASHCAVHQDRHENVNADYAFEKTQAIYEAIDTLIKQLRED